MSANFRVGDKVVVKGWVHERGEYYSFIPEMDEYIGCVTRVRRVLADGIIKLDIDGGNYAWHPSWLAYPKGKVDIYEC